MNAALALLLALAAEPGPWKVVDTQDGLTLSSRELPNERVVELQVQAFSAHSVEALCTAAYGTGALDKDEPTVTSRKVIRQSENERVAYDTVSSPIVSDRDYAVKISRLRQPNGSCKMRFVIDNDEAPPSPKGFVRIEKLYGGWDFEARDGGTACTYRIFTDPAGSVPAVFVEGARKQMTRAWAKVVLNRAKEPEAPDAGRP